MPKTCYVPKPFNSGHMLTIKRAAAILEEYYSQGFILTLRSLYYKFVSRNYIKNELRSYKLLGSIVGQARLAGRIDWDHMEDRIRWLEGLEHFNGVNQALASAKDRYHVDMWENQAWRPEVWIEKDALASMIAKTCHEFDVPYFCCRGYVSLSEMYRTAQRLRYHLENDQTPYIIHFGDHDPSGIDMSRDIFDRLHKTFMSSCKFHRVALNIDQVRELNPPPNPVKVKDSRAPAYVKKYGRESWELDALEPAMLRSLIIENIERIRDKKVWEANLKEEAKAQADIEDLWQRWVPYRDAYRSREKVEAELTKLRAEVQRLKKRKPRPKRKN